MKNCATCDYFIKTKDRDRDSEGNMAHKIGYCSYPLPQSVRKEKINIFYDKDVYVDSNFIEWCSFWRKIFT